MSYILSIFIYYINVTFYADADDVARDSCNLLRQYWGQLEMLFDKEDLPNWKTFVSIVGKVKKSF